MAKSSDENRATFRDIAKLGAALNASLAPALNGPAAIKALRLGTDIDYEKELRRLQVELVKFQHWVRHQGLRVVVVFEGRDAAGKGGAIKRITESLNPRICRVVALTAPPSAKKRSGISSAMWLTSPLPGKSCSSTEVGTTAPEWNE
jgi:polyphosphate kinase 2 (PPK2 family)